MKTSTAYCCLALAVFVSVVQVALCQTTVEPAKSAFDQKAASALAQITAAADKLGVDVAKWLQDRAQAPYDRAAARTARLISARVRSVDALVARIHAKGGNYAECAKDLVLVKEEKVAAAAAAAPVCASAVKTSITELNTHAKTAAKAVVDKVSFDECKPATTATSREQTAALRCVDRRASEWRRLLAEVERSARRLVANRAPALVQRGQRCLDVGCRAVDAAARALATAVRACDRLTSRTTAAPTTTTTTTAAPATPAPTTAAPATAAPTTAAPATPDPATPAPTTPAPATPAPGR